MGWEILVHLFFLSTFSFQNLKMKTSILILKFLLYSNTWKFIPRIKCAFNLMLCHICLEFCALWFEVIRYIRKNKLYCNTLICQRLCSIPPTLINLLFRKLWSSCILLHVEEFLCFSPFALSPPRLCFLLFYLKQGWAKSILVLFVLLKSKIPMQHLIGKKHIDCCFLLNRQ